MSYIQASIHLKSILQMYNLPTLNKHYIHKVCIGYTVAQYTSTILCALSRTSILAIPLIYAYMYTIAKSSYYELLL